MSLMRHVLVALQPAKQSLSVMPYDVAARSFAVLSSLAQRSIVVSRYVATLPITEEERDGRIMRRLDLVFSVFAQHKVDLVTYDRWIDADLDRDLDADRLDDDGDGELDPYRYVVGQRPMVLFAELCRDLGIAAHTLPVEWLETLSPELRLLCARGAAASIRPRRPAAPARSMSQQPRSRGVSTGSKG